MPSHLLGFNEIALADSAETATRLLDTGPLFNLVMCDHYMPNTNGTDLISTIRQDPSHATLPIIMMSAEHDAGQIDNALHSGADEYLIKPFATDDPLAKLNLIGIPAAHNRPPSQPEPAKLGAATLGDHPEAGSGRGGTPSLGCT